LYCDRLRYNNAVQSHWSCESENWIRAAAETCKKEIPIGACKASYAKAARISFSFSTTYCLSFSPSKSTPLYFWYSTVSPLFSVGFTTSPFSLALPLPTATTCSANNIQCISRTTGNKHDNRTMCICREASAQSIAAVTTQPHSHKDACVHSMFAHGQQARTTFSLQGVKVDSLCPELASLCWSLPSADRPLLCPLHLQSVGQQAVRHCMQHIILTASTLAIES